MRVECGENKLVFIAETMPRTAKASNVARPHINMCGNAPPPKKKLISLFRLSLGVLERLEVEEHQASFILAVFLRKEVETVLDIEPRRLGIRINRNEPAASPIAVREGVLDKIQNCPADAFVVVIF